MGSRARARTLLFAAAVTGCQAVDQGIQLHDRVDPPPVLEFTCHKVCDDDDCKLECSEACTFTCRGDADCDLECGAKSRVVCEGKGSCDAVIGAGSTLECRGSGPCDVECTGDCDVICPDLDDCDVECAEGRTCSVRAE